MEKIINGVETYVKMGIQYENMRKCESAISLFKRALVFVQKNSQAFHLEAHNYARIKIVLLLICEVEHVISYLEATTERMKESLDKKYTRVAHGYIYLRVAFLIKRKPESAAQMFSALKYIMDISLGNHQLHITETC